MSSNNDDDDNYWDSDLKRNRSRLLVCGLQIEEALVWVR